jgi:hypothetical protein
MNWFGTNRIRAINEEDDVDLDFLPRRQKFNWTLCVGIFNSILILCTIIFVYTNCLSIMKDIKNDVKNEISHTINDIKSEIGIINSFKDEFGDFKHFTNETLNFINSVEKCARRSGLCHF